MSFTEAQAVAGEGGLVPIQTIKGQYTVGRPGPQNVMVGFCRGRLFTVSESVSGGVDAYASRMKDALGRFGQPALAAISGYGQNGLFSSVQAQWRMADGEEMIIIISTVNGSPIGVSTVVSASLCK